MINAKEEITMERILLLIVMFGGSIALVGGHYFTGKKCDEKEKGSIDGVGHRDGASVFGCAGWGLAWQNEDVLPVQQRKRSQDAKCDDNRDGRCSALNI
jgi:hypothetical protein